MCGGLKTSLFLTYCEQLLPENKTSWSFLQEISKCLCLERQVVGTHSKARKCLNNRRGQGCSLREISGSPGLHHRGGWSGSKRQPPAWCVFACDLWGANPPSCSDSFWRSVKFVKPCFFGLLLCEAELNRICLEGVFSGFHGFTRRGLRTQCLSHSEGFDSFSHPQILAEHLLCTLCTGGSGASANKTKILARRASLWGVVSETPTEDPLRT